MSSGLDVKLTSVITHSDYRKLSSNLTKAAIYAMGDDSWEFAKFVDMNFLRGQRLNKITGDTADSVKAWYDKKNRTWYIRPGVGYGGKNYLNKWINTKREFMRPAFRQFNQGGKITKDVEDAMTKALNDWVNCKKDKITKRVDL